jgi:hypothetical protein
MEGLRKPANWCSDTARPAIVLQEVGRGGLGLGSEVVVVTQLDPSPAVVEAYMTVQKRRFGCSILRHRYLRFIINCSCYDTYCIVFY